MTRIDLAREIITFYNKLPTKEEVKSYILKYRADCPYDTIDILENINNQYGKSWVKQQRCKYTKITAEEIALMRKMNETMTAREIAQEVGMTLKQVQHRLEKGREEAPPAITEEEFNKLYPKYTLQKIAKMKGLAYCTVQKYSKLYGVKKPKRKDFIVMWEKEMKRCSL